MPFAIQNLQDENGVDYSVCDSCSEVKNAIGSRSLECRQYDEVQAELIARAVLEENPLQKLGLISSTDTALNGTKVVNATTNPCFNIWKSIRRATMA